MANNVTAKIVGIKELLDNIREIPEEKKNQIFEELNIIAANKADDDQAVLDLQSEKNKLVADKAVVDQAVFGFKE